MNIHVRFLEGVRFLQSMHQRNDGHLVEIFPECPSGGRTLFAKPSARHSEAHGRPSHSVKRPKLCIRMGQAIEASMGLQSTQQ